MKQSIVRGYCDIILSDDGQYIITNNDYCVLLGNLPIDQIDESFDCIEVDVDCSGHYEYTACIYCQHSTWDGPGELYID